MTSEDKKVLIERRNWLINVKKWKRGKANSAAHRVYWLKKKLFKGPTKFKFIKLDQSERQALGTLELNIIVPLIKGTGRKKPINIVVYYDLEKEEFRSFDISRLL